MTRSPLLVGQRPTPCKTSQPLEVKGERPWSAWPDEHLVAQYARKGTREAFEELVHRYERPLYSYLRRYLDDAGLAEDVFQATFFAVHLHCREFDPLRPFRPWVYRIATTQALDLLRRNRRHKLISLDAKGHSRAHTSGERQADDLPDAQAPSPLEQLETRESRQQLRLLVNSLPPRLKGVLVLVMLRGLAYQEAAEALGIPLNTVKSRLRNAILHLRKTLAAAA